MESCKTTDKSCIEKATAVLREGGVIIYPTDTLYGLGADALSDEAVEKIYQIKVRDERKTIHAIVADVAMMEKYAEMSDMANMLVKEFLPGPLTIILKKREGVDTGIGRGISTIGIRIPDNQFCLALAKRFGKPITATSANLSGQKPERTMKAILKQLRDRNPYASLLQKTSIRNIDLAIDAGGPLRQPADGGVKRQPSTVVDVSGHEPVILREGVISAFEIWNVLGTEF